MLSWLTDSIGSRPLGLARVVIGIAALIRSVVALRVLSDLTDPEVLRTPFFDWMPPPTMPLVIAIITVWIASAVLFAIGWRVNITGGALLAAIVTTIALDQQAYSNHLYLLGWLVLLLVVADAGAAFSVSQSGRSIVRWPVLLIMAQASIVYGFSGLTKLNDSFLSGEVLAGVLVGGPVVFPEVLRTPLFLSSLAAVVIVVELSVATLLWVSRLRPLAFTLGLGLHLSIVLLMEPTLELTVFSLEMLALYPLFLSSDELVLVIDRKAHRRLAWMAERLDLLRVVTVREQIDDVEGFVELTHLGSTAYGFEAMVGVLEHLVPTLWLAPILRLPGVRHLGSALFDAPASSAVSSEA